LNDSVDKSLSSRQLGRALQNYKLPSNNDNHSGDDDDDDIYEDFVVDDDDVNDQSSGKGRRAIRVDALTALKDGYTSLFSFVKKFPRYFELTTGIYSRYDTLSMIVMLIFMIIMDDNSDDDDDDNDDDCEEKVVMICATLSSSDNGVKRARKEFLIALAPRWRSSSTAIRDGERDGEYESSRLVKDSRDDKSDVGDDESSDDSDYASHYDSSDGDDSNSDGDHHDLLSTGSAVTGKGITTSQQKLRRSKSKSSSTTTALSSPLSSNSMKTNVIEIDKIFDALTSYTPTQVIGTTDQSTSRRSLSVDQLKSLLRQHKLPVYGTKDILLARMYENNISTELVL